jgi:hypothetical protein
MGQLVGHGPVGRLGTAWDRGSRSSGMEGVMGAVVLTAGGRRGRRLLLLAGCLILGVLGLGAVEAHAATLAGETFTGQPPKGSTSTLTGTCTGEPNGNGDEGSFNFSVSGTAAGPFPGTFTESGSFTTERSGLLSDFSSTFTIISNSGTVTVTGSKHIAGNLSQASCALVEVGVQFSTSILTTGYTATINGAQREIGPATGSILGVLGGPFLFSENFAYSGVVQLTSKAQCRDGGWQSFGFKNQGDCVSFLATGGKNPPSGS